jgi:hypothetical protein
MVRVTVAWGGWGHTTRTESTQGPGSICCFVNLHLSPCHLLTTLCPLSPAAQPAGKKVQAAAAKKDKQKPAKAAAAAAAAEEGSEGGDEEEEEDDDDAEGGGSSSKVMQVTSSLVEGWTQAALDKASLGAMMQLVKAYRCVGGTCLFICVGWWWWWRLWYNVARTQAYGCAGGICLLGVLRL